MVFTNLLTCYNFFKLSMNKSIIDQKKRYDAEAVQHSKHNNDKYTQMYRDEFIRAPLFKENLKGMYVLDAMCASGTETGYLIKRGADVVGIDVSQKNTEEYKKRWGKLCYLDSIHKTKFSDNTFDAVYICGGLHHVLPLLNETILEIYRILKPGGINVYTVRHTGDGDYKNGTHIGEDLYENDGFIVHFFTEKKVREMADGFKIIKIEKFEEGSFPRKLFRVVLKKK